MNFFQKILWKKKDLNLTIIDQLEGEWKDWLKNLNIKFNFLERKKVANAKLNNKLFPIYLFLERYENILLNNKLRPWFSTRKALGLLDTWHNPIYKKLSVIDSLALKERLVSHNEHYLRFSLILWEKNINKTIYIVREVKDYFLKSLQYKSVTSGPTWWLVWNLMFGVLLILFNTIIVFWGLLSNGTVSYEIFEKHWWDFIPFVTNLLYWAHYIDNSYIATLAMIKITFFISFIVFFLWMLFASIAETFTLYRLREIDKLVAEVWFLKILKIKIKKLELESGLDADPDEKWRVIHNYQNFLDLFKETTLYSLRKGYTNQWFTNDILAVLTLYFNFKKFPQNTKLTEGFQNLLIMILDWYYAMLNGTNPNFTLWAVASWIEEYEKEVQELQWEKHILAWKMMFSSLSNIVTTGTIITVLFMSLSQWTLLERLIKLSLK